jgi:hypothetical protein
VRRKRFEGKLLAREIGLMLFGEKKKPREVPLDVAMAMMGARWE